MFNNKKYVMDKISETLQKFDILTLESIYRALQNMQKKKEH